MVDVTTYIISLASFRDHIGVITVIDLEENISKNAVGITNFIQLRF